MSKALHANVDALAGLDDPDAAFDAAFSLVAYTMNRHLIQQAGKQQPRGHAHRHKHGHSSG
jgi:hypothetical protein